MLYDPPKSVKAQPGIKDCCLDTDNLVRSRQAHDKIIDTCCVCGCRHIKMFGETANLFSRVADCKTSVNSNEHSVQKSFYQFNI